MRKNAYNRAYMSLYRAEVVDGVPVGRIRKMLQLARSRAKEKGLEFSIEPSDVKPVLVCPLLNIALCYSNDKLLPNSPSLDRIDSDKGYVPGNVWIISHKANRGKSDLTCEQLLQLAQNLQREMVARGL